MNARRSGPSAEDLATEANGLATGLGILTMTFFPFALPGLLLALPLLLPVIPLLLVAGVGYLLVRLLLLPVRLVRSALRQRAVQREVGHLEDRPPISAKGRPTPSGIPPTGHWSRATTRT
jgi:hypothetical protein